MSELIVRRSRLVGQIKLSGAKNSALRLLAASLLTDETIILSNFPSKLKDAQIHVGMLEALGKKCTLLAEDQIKIEQGVPLKAKLVWEGRSIRNTLLILGALTARLGEGRVPLPGGCKLGDRSYDIHEYVLRELGAEVDGEGNELFTSTSGKRLAGSEVRLRIRSTGATENAILCSVLASGITNIWNPHIRPEIFDLIGLLRRMGAMIVVHGQERIEVHGVKELGGASYSVMPDNMEAVTWAVASAITNGDIEVSNFPFDDLEVALIHLRESGVKIFRNDDTAIIRGSRCYPIEISTGPHPGINSDVQPILAAYAACAIGESVIVDLRFPGRYGYAEEMRKMGVISEVDGNLLRVHGSGGNLSGARVKAVDLRAGAALMLLGLRAEGETVIEDSWQIERGYNDIVAKLAQLGGDVVHLEGTE